jgi:hypothetical protein
MPRSKYYKHFCEITNTLHYYLHFIKSSILLHQQHERLQALKWSCGATRFQDETTTSNKHTTLTETTHPA